ncbi:small multi-drug export protein [Evansella sp. LMS18]|uniref:small multi-drug export protein n=1 Tax=Evansella sp. LMS18 TaxID=2924033 RepID=UPI0020D0BC9E|nr:small multi-drug export protein [Evansella sp. LMS18]UTR08951.1 small multi-drug export protein [Evansella sp. LMS18]
MLWETLWQYILIFVMAATPWLEILIVIPIGIAMGLNPYMVGIVSFIGNFLPIILIVYLLKWFQQTKWYQDWQEKRRFKKLQKQRKKEAAGTNRDMQSGTSETNHIESSVSSQEFNREKNVQGADMDVQGPSENPDASNLPAKRKSSKKEKAAAIFHKYGLPGLAFVGPIITGIHLAAVIALSLKSDKLKTTIWMGISLILWTIVITAASYYGIDWITRWF